MEDILASIRRIIADDQNQAAPQQVNGARRPANTEADRAVPRVRTPYDDVLDLARMTPAARSEAAVVPVDHEAADAMTHRGAATDHDETSTAVTLRARLPEPSVRAQGEEEGYTMLDHSTAPLDDEEDLLSAPLGASVLSAFETLAATVVLQNQPMLERVMRDLLRPMLKTWLDDNLPSLVERLVRGEIERVARGVRD